MGFDVYTALLKMFADFHENSGGVCLSYDMGGEKLQELRLKYGLDSIAGGGDDFSRAKNLLHWVSTNNYHDGGQSVNLEMNALRLLEYSFQKGKGGGINCRSLAAVLTECLLSIGIKAHTLFLMPFSIYDGDNHVVTQAYIKELDKLVMLDPSFEGYVMNKENQPLNVFEIREILADQGPIHFNRGIHHNDTEWGEEEPFYQEYLAKNLFWFQTHEKSCFNANTKSHVLYTAPLGFDVKKHQILNIEFRIRKNGDAEGLQNWLRDTKGQIFNYVHPNTLLEKP
jgi:hypothetical protein